MGRRLHNVQFFALQEPPSAAIELVGRTYRLIRVFKHDFWAATCLYETDADAEWPKVVVKLTRRQPFCGLPMAWVGRLTGEHEEAIYAAIAGVPGVPRWLGRVRPGGFAIEFIDAQPLDHVAAAPAGFFERLREIFDQVHARGVAYCDANKRSNILVGPEGRPHLIDFQISLRRRDDLPWPLRAINRAFFRYMIQRDLYHLYKHKRRISPDELTPDQEAISRRRGLLLRVHRKLTDPYRWLRRRFLRKRYRAGQMTSPTAGLEDHHQPEKATWRD